MDHIPTRKITNTGTRKNTGFFPSQKNERPVAFESLLELDYIYLLEFDDDVVKYTEQPLTITYTISNRSYKYTPDFLVERKNKTQLIEIKPESKLQIILNDESKFNKYKAAAQYCKSKEYSSFEIVTDNDIRNGNLLNNVKFLFAYHNVNVPAINKLKIRNELVANGPQQICQLLTELCENETQFSKFFSYILSLLYSHEIRTNLLEPINKNSIVVSR